jgi:hypothetical protein
MAIDALSSDRGNGRTRRIYRFQDWERQDLAVNAGVGKIQGNQAFESARMDLLRQEMERSTLTWNETLESVDERSAD